MRQGETSGFLLPFFYYIMKVGIYCRNTPAPGFGQKRETIQMRKKLTALLACLLAFSMMVQPVHAARTREEIQQEREEKKKEQENTQSRYEEAQGKLGDLEDEQGALQEEIDELDNALMEIIASVSLMEEQMAETREQIEKARQEYDAAKAQEEAQYQAMKLRIRHLYEKGETSYVELLMKAASWSEMFNQAGYVEKLYEYDIKMLSQYIAMKEEVATKKSNLEDIMSDLETQKYELEEEEKVMQALMEEKKEASADYEAQMFISCAIKSSFLPTLPP